MFPGALWPNSEAYGNIVKRVAGSAGAPYRKVGTLRYGPVVGTVIAALAAFRYSADTIRVPGDVPTIEDALAATGPGDTVLVAPGTYYVNLEWPATESIKLVGGEGPEATILENLIFTGNTAENHGGGLYCEDGSPIVRNCAFVENNSGSGGGAWFQGRSVPRVVGCQFDSNAVVGVGGGVGAHLSVALSLVSCEVQGNSARSGGGVRVSAAEMGIEDCSIRDNVATFGGAVNLMSAIAAEIDETEMADNQADLSGVGESGSPPVLSSWSLIKATHR